MAWTQILSPELFEDIERTFDGDPEVISALNEKDGLDTLIGLLEQRARAAHADAGKTLQTVIADVREQMETAARIEGLLRKLVRIALEQARLSH